MNPRNWSGDRRHWPEYKVKFMENFFYQKNHFIVLFVLNIWKKKIFFYFSIKRIRPIQITKLSTIWTHGTTPATAGFDLNISEKLWKEFLLTKYTRGTRFVTNRGINTMNYHIKITFAIWLFSGQKQKCHICRYPTSLYPHFITSLYLVIIDENHFCPFKNNEEVRPKNPVNILVQRYLILKIEINIEFFTCTRNLFSTNTVASCTCSKCGS